MFMSETLKGFCIQKGYSGREVNAVLDGAVRMGVGVCWSEEALDGCVPVGTVEFCAPVFGDHRVDFFPGFLWDLLNRGVCRTTKGQLYRPMFVKDATAWKSDYVTELKPSGYILPPGDWWVSEPVTFVNEWRYYVANGRVVTTGWYAGEDEDAPASPCEVEWPEGFSGAVDFGVLENGTVSLVECHAPFACGWYGERHEDYARWLWESWKDRSSWLTE